MSRKILSIVLIIAALFSFLAVQFQGASAAGETVNVWVTTPDQSKLLAQQTAVTFGTNSGSNPLTITVNPNTRYQQMDGWGASFTDSSAWLVFNSSARNSIMNDLFSTTSGIGLSFLRQPIGASDFSRSGNYNFDNTCCDTNDFSISHDNAYIIPIVQQARSINPEVKVMLSPWSAPGWMKTSGSMIGGTLNHATYSDAFASYLVKSVQGYQAAGIPIYALTVQNEPLFQPSGYPGMGMPAADQGGFIGFNLGPALRNAGLNTKIMVYDHNWDQSVYPTTVFSNATAAQYVAGVAWHCYGGNVSAQQTVHNAYPNMDTWLTECSGGDWQPYYNDFAANLKGFTENQIILNARYWGKSAILWNMALDSGNGPTNGGCTTCRGVVTVNGGSYTKTVDYYILGHASKFVRSGAYRIDSNTFGGNSIENVAFQNPDGSLVVLALNNASSSQTFKVVWNGQAFSYTLPAGAVGTFKWSPGVSNPTQVPTFQPPTTIPPTSSPINSSAWYQVINQGNSKCVDDADGGTANGTLVQQWACAANNFNQQWQFRPTSGGYYQVVNRHASTLVWDVSNVSTADNAAVHLWAYVGGNNQQWQPVSMGGGYYKFVNRNSGKCLDVPAASTADGTKLVQYTCNGTGAQSFRLSQQP